MRTGVGQVGEISKNAFDIKVQNFRFLLRQGDVSDEGFEGLLQRSPSIAKTSLPRYPILPKVRASPAISVDTKKKEVLGNLKNSGRVYRRSKDPVKVDTHDFPKPELGKAIPYGVYDLQHNEALVSVGVSHDTAQFAVATILLWWKQLGQKRFPKATRLLVTADYGGSNSPRTRLWRVELQRLANLTGLTIEVCHYPPGTSKWNKIQHSLFCHITRNWRGVPLESLEIVVNLIAATRTTTGLEVHAWLDEKDYPPKIKVSDEELAFVNIHRNKFHGEWNYEIRPQVEEA